MKELRNWLKRLGVRLLSDKGKILVDLLHLGRTVQTNIEPMVLSSNLTCHSLRI